MAFNFPQLGLATDAALLRRLRGMADVAALRTFLKSWAEEELPALMDRLGAGGSGRAAAAAAAAGESGLALLACILMLSEPRLAGSKHARAVGHICLPDLPSRGALRRLVRLCRGGGCPREPAQLASTHSCCWGQAAQEAGGVRWRHRRCRRCCCCHSTPPADGKGSCSAGRGGCQDSQRAGGRRQQGGQRKQGGAAPSYQEGEPQAAASSSWQPGTGSIRSQRAAASGAPYCTEEAHWCWCK